MRSGQNRRVENLTRLLQDQLAKESTGALLTSNYQLLGGQQIEITLEQSRRLRLVGESIRARDPAKLIRKEFGFDVLPRTIERGGQCEQNGGMNGADARRLALPPAVSAQ